MIIIIIIIIITTWFLFSQTDHNNNINDNSDNYYYYYYYHNLVSVFSNWSAPSSLCALPGSLQEQGFVNLLGKFSNLELWEFVQP